MRFSSLANTMSWMESTYWFSKVDWLNQENIINYLPHGSGNIFPLKTPANQFNSFKAYVHMWPVTHISSYVLKSDNQFVLVSAKRLNKWNHARLSALHTVLYCRHTHLQLNSKRFHENSRLPPLDGSGYFHLVTAWFKKEIVFFSKVIH